MNGNPRISNVVRENGRYRILYSDIKPSTNGKEVLTGTLLGSLTMFALFRLNVIGKWTTAIKSVFNISPAATGLLPGLAGFGVAIGIGMGLSALGGYLGGLVNKWEENGYKKNGRVIGKPSRWNREMFRGTAMGLFFSQLAVLAFAAIGHFAGLPFLGSGIAAVALSAAGAIYGAYKGSQSGVQRMEFEYQRAARLHQRIQSGEVTQEELIEISPEQQQALTPGKVTTVTGAAAGVATGLAAHAVMGPGAAAGATQFAAEQTFTGHAWPEDPNHPAAQRQKNYWQNHINAGRNQPQLGEAALQQEAAEPRRPSAVSLADTAGFRQMVEEQRIRDALAAMQKG